MDINHLCEMGVMTPIRRIKHDCKHVFTLLPGQYWIGGFVENVPLEIQRYHYSVYKERGGIYKSTTGKKYFITIKTDINSFYKDSNGNVFQGTPTIISKSMCVDKIKPCNGFEYTFDTVVNVQLSDDSIEITTPDGFYLTFTKQMYD